MPANGRRDLIRRLKVNAGIQSFRQATKYSGRILCFCTVHFKVITHYKATKCTFYKLIF